MPSYPKQLDFEKVSIGFQNIQDFICQEITTASHQNYQEELWEYSKGGGGKTRIFSGEQIEKGGVNFSSISSDLEKNIAAELQLPFSKGEKFQVCGVSLILHPYNPFVPAVHLNIRYFQSKQNRWFGGGIDLNPYYALEKDIIFFHQKLKEHCCLFDKDYYSQFKKNCDHYFYLPHRKETRGVSGIFFDRLAEKNFDFVQSFGLLFQKSYIPIFQKRKEQPFQAKHREYQSFRRGRYVEFNLLYDKGTAFGLKTGGRIESIFLSLPPSAKWSYKFPIKLGSEEEKSQKFFVIKDWVTS